MIKISQVLRPLHLLLLALVLSGCAAAQQPGGINDPFESTNRRVHEFNKALDLALIRPAATAYGTVVPEPVRKGLDNFASNLSQPRYILNDLLQLKLKDALHNSVRLVVNTTIGLGGIWDAASAAGVEPRETDFGETLHVWGVGEGVYLELPFVGPSTGRDAVGSVVDLVIDPMNYILPENRRYIPPALRLGAKLGSRYRFRSTIDSLLHESADSYLQGRLLYLENRRFKLRGGDSAPTTNEGEQDLYDDLYQDLVPE